MLTRSASSGHRGERDTHRRTTARAPAPRAMGAVVSMVLECDRVVGGISRTARDDGWKFDIGGHRLFTKVQPVEDLWHEILCDDEFLQRPRMSRISYNGKYYDYPIKPFNALRN